MYSRSAQTSTSPPPGTWRCVPTRPSAWSSRAAGTVVRAGTVPRAGACTTSRTPGDYRRPVCQDL